MNDSITFNLGHLPDSKKRAFIKLFQLLHCFSVINIVDDRRPILVFPWR